MRPNSTKQKPRRVAVLDLPDALPSSFALSGDVLSVANRAAASISGITPFRTLVLSPGQRRPVNLSALVLPGAGCATYEEVGQMLHSKHGQWAVRMARSAHAAGVYIATSCASVFVAAAAGILEGQRATTSWFLASDLAVQYPRIQVQADCVLVESGSCLTGGAALAHADVMLALVERFAGHSVADLCAKYLLLDRRQSQRPYLVLSALIQNDPQLANAEAWIIRHLALEFSVDDVAAAVGLGTRTFARRLKKICGLSPIQFIQRIRVDVTKDLIEKGTSFEAAAPLVGYKDATTLRRVFRKLTAR